MIKNILLIGLCLLFFAEAKPQYTSKAAVLASISTNVRSSPLVPLKADTLKAILNGIIAFGGSDNGTPVNLELADTSANTTITLNHAALSNTLILMKNGSVLPPFKYSVNGALVRLVDPRIPADIFLSNYKF